VSGYSLVFERIVEVSPDSLFRGWTEPDLLVQWFTPAPWRTTHAEVDLRPGGIFRTVMQSPEGDEVDEGAGCVLEVVPNRRFVWTSAFGPGYIPNDFSSAGFPMTVVVEFEPHGDGTRYKAIVHHASQADRDAHEQMGFHDGWSAAFDQLVVLVGDRRR
jgi:uncharacterized protein YndB with AHSA1/START domain